VCWIAAERAEFTRQDGKTSGGDDTRTSEWSIDAAGDPALQFKIEYVESCRLLGLTGTALRRRGYGDGSL
jgi:hypothetical protein